MLKNYLKTALRNLIRNKTYSVINIMGFAIGLTISILLIFYIKHELSFDSFHEHKDHIYRLGFKQQKGNETEIYDYNLAVMGPELAENSPQIEEFVRFSNYRGGTLMWNNQGIGEPKIRYADESLFDVFSFHLIRGSEKTALEGPNKIIITRNLAKKIFGETDPMGKVINYNKKNDLIVTGIVEQPPSNSHIQFSALISFETIHKNYSKSHLGWNGGWAYFTYLKMNPGQPDKQFYQQANTFMYEKIGKRYERHGWKITPLLHPLEDIYMQYEGLYTPQSSGNLKNIYVFSAIAVFILLIASINFMNLTTAQSIKRIKEVGVRKVTGASRKRLIYQFIGESLLITFLSFILAAILIEVFLPQFNHLLGTKLSIYTWQNIEILLGVPLLVLTVGILAGSYPAFFLSSYEPGRILKGSTSSGKRKHSLRNALIVFQFVISIALIISSVIIYSQLHFIQNKKLGYNKENLISIDLENEEIIAKDKVLKNRLLDLPEIQNVSVASAYPGFGLGRYGFIPQGEKKPVLFHVVDVDPDYLETLGLKIKEGRNFRKDSKADQTTILINERLARYMNWEEPLDKYLERNGKHKIIGVVKDFHFATLHEKIQPLVFRFKSPWADEKVLVKINDEDVKGTLSSIRKTWKNLFGGIPMHYEFVDKTFQRAYKVDIRFSQTILFFTILAIFIASLGLFGLTAFSTEQRTKEIGIRKAMGATTSKINVLIIKQFVRWVMIANIIAWPLAWYFMNKWLQDYAYKIDLHPGYFIVAAIMAFAIAILTISYQSIKAARTNPANSLRYE